MGVKAAYAVPHPPLLIPGVGGGTYPEVQKTKEAFEAVARQSAGLAPETLVIFSPHATSYTDYFHISPGAGARGDFGSFGAPQAAYSVAYDEEFVHALEAELVRRGIPGGTEGERNAQLDHGTMVPLHFFGGGAGDEGGAGRGVKVVRIGLSGLGREQHKALGEAVAAVAEGLGRRTVIIASGDLSHKLLQSGPYGFVPEGPEFDEELTGILASGDLSRLSTIDEDLSEAAAECGLRSFIMMAGALDDALFTSELLSYEGPYGVGYAVAAFVVTAQKDGEIPKTAKTNSNIKEAEEPTPAEYSDSSSEIHGLEESLPVALARATLSSFFDLSHTRPNLETPALKQVLARSEQTPESRALLQELRHKRAGAFVSLHENGELRGCIGTIGPTQESVLAEIIQNAVSAAREDPRFPPVGQDELSSLDIKVDILGAPEPVIDRSTLDAERYGVIVSSGYRRGLLLPALEGVDTPEQQIAIALSKARISADEPYELERFEVVRYT